LYEFPVDAAIKALKFRRHLYYLPVFGDLLVCEIAQQFGDVDGLVPVPLHWWRHARRGFNQATELCKRIRRDNGLPIVAKVTRIRATKTQSGLSAEERRKNLRGAFEISGPLRFRHLLIVDDVMTTGATCGQLSKVLLAAGAEKVSVLTIARAREAD
jgi:ComF family protein